MNIIVQTSWLDKKDEGFLNVIYKDQVYIKYPKDQVTKIQQLTRDNTWYLRMILIQRSHDQVKFMFSKKATKIDEIFTVDLTLTT